MKKLLSLALVLTMLFTIIAVPSVSADAVGENLTTDFTTVAKMGFETGDPVPKKVSGQSYNIFTTGAKDPDGTAFASNLNTTPSGTTYESNSITAPVAEGETFGSNVIKIDFRNKNIGSYTAIRGRLPFSISETCTVAAGKLYRLSAWVRLDEFAVADATSGLVGLKIGDDINTDVAAADCVTLQKGQWTKVVTEFSPSATLAKSNCVILTIRGTNAPILAYVDNIRIEELDQEKTGSEIVAYTSFGVAKTYGTGTSSTYAKTAGSATTFPTSGEIFDNYVKNENSTANVVVAETSPLYYPGIPNIIFKKTSTSAAWLMRFTGAMAASDLAEGDVVRMSMDVYNTDVVAHAKKKDGTMGAAAELDAHYIQMYPTAGSGKDVSSIKVTAAAPTNQWYRLEKVFTVPSGWAATGVRVDFGKTQVGLNAFNEPFPSTTYFTNYKFEKITDTSATVNVGVSSEIAGLTVTGAGEHNVGSQVTVTAPAKTPDNSKKFKGWYDGAVCVSTSASYKFTAVTPVNLVAKYEENIINVNVTAYNDRGSVTGTGSYAYGAEATVTATVNEGYVFEGWYDAASDVIVSRDAEYTFTATEDKDMYAYFIPAAVNGWNLLSNVDAEDGWSPSTSSNFWGKDSTTQNGNSSDMSMIVTYESEAEAIQKPNDTEDFGSMLIKADKAHQPTATTGVGTFRINGIEGIRYNAGDIYKMSAWMYIAQTDDETKTQVKVPMAVVHNSGGSAYVDTKTVTVPVGEWTKVESIFTVAEDSALIGKTTTGWRATLDSYVTVMYMDNFKIEKFDGVTVSAEAANGVVYGAGEYKKGDQATLIAAGNTGYVFEGYYVGDECVSTNAKYTFTVEDDITVEAKFVERAEATFPENNLYHWGAETGELGSYNSWYKWVGQENASDNKADGAGVITWAQAAELGVAVPSNDPTFGDNLYADNFANPAKTIAATVDGRMRGWENGNNVNNSSVTEKTEASGRYIEGKQYKFTWWVYPKSMRVVDDTDTYVKNNETRLKITHNDGKSTGITTTQTLNVGEWNKIEWVFTANAQSALYAPGIYYQWVSSGTADSEGKKNIVNCAFYDNIQVEEITTWEFGDTAEPSGWVARGAAKGLDTAFHGATAYNKSILHVETYDEVGVAKPSTTCGDHVFVFDVTRPNVVEKDYNPIEGSIFWPEDGEKMSYEDALAIYSSYETLTGDLAGRFNNIASAGTLTIGKTYKISLKVYIDEIRNIEEEGCPVVADATNKVTITGTHTKSAPVGDGKQVSKVVAQDTWTEISYTFKATEAGAECPPSLRIDFAKDLTKFPTLVYVDDVRVDQIHVDDLDLVIEDGETEVTATATVYDIKTGDTINAIVIIAGYDVDGKLVSVSFSNNGASKALAINDTISATYTKADTVDSYVAFLWDDLTNIRPYTTPKTLGE